MYNNSNRETLFYFDFIFEECERFTVDCVLRKGEKYGRTHWRLQIGNNKKKLRASIKAIID